jgi:DNA-binding winged helix-turn-helix (wHTH) protein/cytochrome c-type biogenesis protein CcmH/NrfG
MPASASIYRFGPFVLERPAFRVLRDDEPLALSPKLVDLLLYFVSRPALLITKDELLGAIWPDVAVTENALTQAVSDLRQALGDDPASPRYIQTVARRGYRFIAPVESLEPLGGPARADTSDGQLISEPGGLRSVAVLDFVNLSKSPDLDWLSTGIAETVTNDLSSFKVLRVVDRVGVGEAERRTDQSLPAVARELGVQLVVVGSYQHAGGRLRITARIVEVATGGDLAEAKVDGRIEDVFDLQDRIVRQFSASLGVEATTSAGARLGVRETSNLEALRAASEARIKLDSLDPKQIADAIDGFERAVALDPRYALAHAGLANAHFFLFEATRSRNRADTDRLTRAIGHARRAVDLDDTLAEGHATLAFILTSVGKFAEAVAAGRRAVALDPTNWQHFFRLGHAAWGSERIDALQRALALYPDIAFAYTYMAMVHIARNRLDHATGVVHHGIDLQDQQGLRSWRYPGCGLHWLLGLILLAKGDTAGALGEFDREVQTTPLRRVYSAEAVMNAHDGAGFAHLARREFEQATGAFARALDLFPDHARSRIGMAAACHGLKDEAGAGSNLQHAETLIAELVREGRVSEALLLTAFAEAVRGRHAGALSTIDRMLSEAPTGALGWSIPIEPLLKPLHALSGFEQAQSRLADRSR